MHKNIDKLSRKVWIEIDVQSIKRNITIIRKQLKGKEFMAVIKANAYGHGLKEVASIAISMGCTYLVVASMEEAMELRLHYDTFPILVLGSVNEYDFYDISQYHISISVYDEISYHHILECDFDNIKVHINVDTGMNRLGFKYLDDITEVIDGLHSKPNILIEGIYTHFKACDSTNHKKQYDRFNYILDQLEYHFKFIHVSNSAAILTCEQNYSVTTSYRLGLAMYGLNPGIKKLLSLQESFTLKSKIIAKKRLFKGDTIGYEYGYTAKKECYIGVISIGYGDGFLRKNTGRDVMINGKKTKIVGTICMDHCFLLIDELDSVGDEVILIGEDISIDYVAQYLETINYEVICMINQRVKRLYFE